MSKLKKINSRSPMNQRVMLYWDCLNHFEDGKLWKGGNNILHSLFDGECLSEQPSHWMPLPEPPKS